MLLLVVACWQLSSARPANPAANGKDVVLKASDITAKIFPDSVFYRGRVAPVQMRNTGGVHFGDDFYVLAGLVDNSGYSSGVKEKYQGYLLVEVPLQVGGQTLKPGSYGFGFLEGPKFAVTDLAGNDVFQADAKRDAELKRPVPLQVVAAEDGSGYRLYKGRDYVTFGRAK
jgi:hypothetical protein